MFGTLDITKIVNTKENTKEILINNIGADLNYTYKYTNNGKIDYTVIPFSQMESKYLNYYYQGKSLESVYNEFSKVLTKYDDSIKIEALKELPTN